MRIAGLLNITQRDVAEMLGLSPSYLSKILNDHAVMPVGVPERLDAILRVLEWALDH